MNLRLCKKVLSILILLLAFPGLSAMAESPRGKYVIVIDAAHGGTDKGVKLSRNLYEKDVTLAIAKGLRGDLNKTKSIKVYLTRSTDKNVSTPRRMKAPTKLKADLFISLSINAGFGKSSSGYEVYYPGFKKMSSKKGESNDIAKDMVRNRYLNESVRFAQIVMKNIEKVFPRQGRGLRNAPIPILDGLTIPAVVIELGFATNVKDRNKLKSEKIQESIAKALSKSIKEYFSTSGA